MWSACPIMCGVTHQMQNGRMGASTFLGLSVNFCKLKASDCLLLLREKADYEASYTQQDEQRTSSLYTAGWASNQQFPPSFPLSQGLHIQRCTERDRNATRRVITHPNFQHPPPPFLIKTRTTTPPEARAEAQAQTHLLLSPPSHTLSLHHTHTHTHARAQRH